MSRNTTMAIAVIVSAVALLTATTFAASQAKATQDPNKVPIKCSEKEHKFIEKFAEPGQSLAESDPHKVEIIHKCFEKAAG